MTGKTDVLSQDFLEHYFLNLAIEDVGDASGLPAAATTGFVYLGLCISEPGEDGDPAGHECTYTDYARKAVARSATYWEIWTNGSGDKAIRNKLVIDWDDPKGDSGSVTATYVGVSRTVSGFFDYIGLVTSPATGLVIGENVQPRALAQTISFSED